MSKFPVMLHIRGTQNYQDQEPEVIELTTEGTLEKQKEVWEVSYEESDLTGLAGVTTTFRVGPRGVVLKRTGACLSARVTPYTFRFVPPTLICFMGNG